MHPAQSKSHNALRALIPAMLISAALIQCTPDHTLYNGQHLIDAEGWSDADPATFIFAVTDTSQRYDLLLDVAHRTEYRWQNLYVRITTEFPDDPAKTDILSLELSDGRGGWAGRCRREHCRITIPLQERVRFPAPGSYSLTFEPWMRVPVVHDVEGLVLRLVLHER